jgi:hypothetical protein
VKRVNHEPSAGATLPAAVVWSIFSANVILKGLVTLASLPGIYLVKEP